MTKYVCVCYSSEDGAYAVAEFDNLDKAEDWRGDNYSSAMIMIDGDNLRVEWDVDNE